MEVCRGDPQGRGYQVDKVWGTIQETRVVQASKATAAGWWSRMRRCIITLQAQLSRSTWEQVQGNAKAADVFLQREVGRPEEASFVEEVSRAFEQRQVKALGKLREAAEANEAEAQVQASKASQKQYKAWLNAGVAKGMRPLFRSLAKAENVFIRPFQDTALESVPSFGDSNGSNCGGKRDRSIDRARFWRLRPSKTRFRPLRGLSSNELQIG